MFKMESAWVYYGSSRYPLNGLEEYDVPMEIESVEDIDLSILSEVVGQLTSFPREFKAKLIDPMDLIPEEFHDEPLVKKLKRSIVATADGYTITWIEEK